MFCLYVHCPPEEGIRSDGIAAIDLCEPPCGCFLTTEPAPLSVFSFNKKQRKLPSVLSSQGSGNPL